jgi:hypothetical protein
MGRINKVELLVQKGRSADTARLQNDCENRASRNSPSFAVALNCQDQEGNYHERPTNSTLTRIKA